MLIRHLVVCPDKQERSFRSHPDQEEGGEISPSGGAEKLNMVSATRRYALYHALLSKENEEPARDQFVRKSRRADRSSVLMEEVKKLIRDQPSSI